MRDRFARQIRQGQPSAWFTRIAMFSVFALLSLALGFSIFRIRTHQKETPTPVRTTTLLTPTAPLVPSVTPTVIPHTQTPTPTPEQPDAAGYGYRIQQVRYGLHPDKVRVVVDLEVLSPSTTEQPEYHVETINGELIVRFDFGGFTTSLVPEPAYQRVLGPITLTSSEGAKSTMRAQLNSPIRLEHFVLHQPERIVFDLYPLQ